MPGTKAIAAQAKQGQRRTRDASRARQTILDAAETVFAEHGFHGARVEAVAKSSGYNVSLLFQYFGDKVGLYTAVLRRAHEETTRLQSRLVGQKLDRALTSDMEEFRVFLKSLVHSTFDWLAEHPRMLRILTWEMASGWRTYTSVAAQFEPDADAQQLALLFQRAQDAGWLRPQFPAMIQLTLIFQVCQSYLAFLPFYHAILTGDQGASACASPSERDLLAQFIVAGMVFDSASRKQPRRRRGQHT